VAVPALSASSQLHHIPSVLPEAILATKEVNEKARTAAFDLLVVMGRKMTEGGVVKRNLIDGIAAMDLDGDAKEGELFLWFECVCDVNLYVFTSKCKRGGIHDHGSCWLSRVYAAHDQCLNYCYIPPAF